MKKEKMLWNMAMSILENHGEIIDDMHLIEFDIDHGCKQTIRIYHAAGYCFEITKQMHCEPEEIDEYNDIQDIQPDGCTYEFGEPYDEFREIGIDKAIEELKNYTDLN